MNAAVPVVVYLAARRFGASDGSALVAAAIFPAASTAIGLVRARTLNPVAILILIGLAASGIGLALGGGPRVLLIRESFVSAAFSVACLVSFALPRPLMFYFGRYFASGGDPRRSAEYDALWQYRRFRNANRLITAVWAVAFGAEFVVRVALAWTLPTAVVLGVGPIVTAGIIVGTIAWTFWYAARVRARAPSTITVPDTTAAMRG